MARFLRKRGYRTVNWGYPSRHHTIVELADLLAAEVGRHEAERVNFVTHSMGGIITRTFLSTHRPANLGRVVMIAPPNRGAELADRLRGWGIYRGVFGPAGQDLCTGPAGACRCAGVPPCEFGIIAGGLGNRIGFNPLLPGDNDGIVTVDSTRIDGASDFLVVPHMHFIIQMMPKTLRSTELFLRTGRFSGIAL